MSINDIKSSYFIIILFSHLREEMKLKMVKYNKNYQHLLNIKLINYQIFSGRYIEYESNGKTKEYDSYDDHLIYEGEYSNGKRNGKGKEYYKYGKGIILFEGEYFNGKRWNEKVKDTDGHKTYELKNGNGYFKEYHEDENYLSFVFEGVYMKGEKNGKGKE